MLKRFISVSVVSILLASIWLTPAISAIINATTVNGIGASRTATAGYLYPLDSARKFPNAVLHTGHGGGLNADAVDGLHASNIVNRTSPAWKPQTRHYSVGSSDFQSHYNVVPDAVGRWGNAYSTASEHLAAPIHLPDGAVMNKVTLFYFDNDPSSNMNLQIWSHNHVTNGDTQITLAGPPIGSSGWAGRGNAQKVLSGVAAVNNAQSTYYVLLSFTNAGRSVEAVVIDYTTTKP